MNGALLNVWRENGAYLRFADAKNGLLASISMAVLISYMNFVLISDGANWFSVPAVLSIAILSFVDYMVCTCLIAAILLSSLSIIPTLSKMAFRTQLLLKLAVFFGVVKAPSERGVIYFLEVAGFSNSRDFSKRLEECFGDEDFTSLANQDLIEQIWIVSRIGSAKHFTFLLSSALLFVAVLFSFFHR